MPNLTRKRHEPTARRLRAICVLCLVFAPLVSSLRHDPSQFALSTTSHIISQIPRGGDNNNRRNNHEDTDDDEERTRFWSLSALFRLNANAKDDAASSSPSYHLQRGNKRGGALAVRTSKSKTFVDVTPVSTASSRMISDAVLSDDDADDTIEPLETVFEHDISEEDSETIEMEEIEEMEVLEEEDIEEEEESDEETLPMTDRFMDTAPVSTASTRIVEDVEEVKKDEDTEVGIEQQVADAAEMTGVEVLQTMREVTVYTDEPTARVEADLVAEDRDSTAQESSAYIPARAKGMLQDATKYWWTNVWTEQTSEEIPELQELVSDESDADTSSASGAAETIQEPEKEMEQVGEMEIIDAELVGVQEVELEEMTEQEPSTTEEPPSQLSLRREEEEILETLEGVDIDIDATATESLEAVPQDSVEAEKSEVLISDTVVQDERPRKEESPFVSSGYWGTIDRVFSLGLSDVNPSWKLSRRLRYVRKATAHVTGLHGVISRKKRLTTLPENAITPSTGTDATLNEEDLGMIQRRIAAIEIAKQNVAKRAAENAEVAVKRRRGLFRRRRRENQIDNIDASATAGSRDLDESEISSMYLTLERKSLEEQLEDERRKERVQEIDRLISKGQKDLLDLQCEKDDLQRRPNPLYNYTTATDGKTTRDFNFPPQELVDEYIGELFANGRLEKMNHTHLWKNGAGFDDDEDESIGDDLFVPSADARKLYEIRQEDEPSSRRSESKSGNGNGGGGSWLLRQNLGKGGSLGEKIGEATETAAYKAVCTAVMSALARSIAAIHGVNIMTHSDIRLYMEQSPDLPPLGKNVIPGSNDAQNYAQEAIMDAMRKGVTKRKKRSSRSRRLRVEEAFLQRDAVVETLLSHCQISAPLLKLFPLSWQRALLGNIITLIASVVSDFCDGIQLQILGHQLSFAFKPITESDMIRHIGMAGNGFNHRRAKPEKFEAAIRATAEDVSENLQFLDRWHHRALGSGMLRAQIANLIARIVLTLADEVLSGARMDLWSAQAGGPRMLAGLEYRPQSLDQVL